jgi:hypothetical protein
MQARRGLYIIYTPNTLPWHSITLGEFWDKIWQNCLSVGDLTGHIISKAYLEDCVIKNDHAAKGKLLTFVAKFYYGQY